MRALHRAEPVAARLGLKLAAENHKDHLVKEKVDILKRLSSEYVGACLDVADNLALCEDPLDWCAGQAGVVSRVAGIGPAD